jgi:hypothetical protein
MRPRSDAATDGDRLGVRVISDGGLDQTRPKPSPVLLHRGDTGTYPQRWRCEISSKKLAIDDESGVLGHFVIELHRCVIGLVSLPVHTR